MGEARRSGPRSLDANCDSGRLWVALSFPTFCPQAKGLIEIKKYPTEMNHDLLSFSLSHSILMKMFYNSSTLIKNFAEYSQKTPQYFIKNAFHEVFAKNICHVTLYFRNSEFDLSYSSETNDSSALKDFSVDDFILEWKISFYSLLFHKKV